jgi:hypothetical protein
MSSPRQATTRRTSGSRCSSLTDAELTGQIEQPHRAIVDGQLRDLIAQLSSERISMREAP